MATEKLDLEPPSPTENKQLPTPPPELATSSVTGSLASFPQNKKNEAVAEPPKTEGSTTAGKVEESTKPKDEEPKLEEKKDESSTAKTKDSDARDGSSDKTEPSKEDDPKKDAAKKDEVEDERKDEKKEEEKKKALPRGMKLGVKLLWAKTDAQCKCCTTWVEENPDEGKNVEESDECLQHAIVVRKKKKHEGNRKPLKVDSIVIHSPLIKKVLQKVFEDYPDLVIDLEELVFDAPFAPFFHRWEQFEKFTKDETDEKTKSHLTLLYDALAAELKPTIQRHKDLIRHKAIDFEILWTLFAPSTLMFSHDNGHDRLYETTDCEYWQDLSGMKFTVRCDMIDWDGEKFGKVMMSENISKFKGTRQITTLPSYPLHFHPKAEEMKKKCVERGRRFQSLAGVNCKDSTLR